MAAYVVGRIHVKDPEQWAEYRRRVPATLEPWGGELMLRGRQGVVLSGEEPHSDLVVLRFPDMAAATGWHDSVAYRELVPVRQAAADVTLVCYEEDDG